MPCPAGSVRWANRRARIWGVCGRANRRTRIFGRLRPCELGSGKLAGCFARRAMRACAEAVFRRTLACHGHPPVFGRRPGPNVRKRKTAVEFSRMHIRSAQPVTVPDGWKERRGVSIRKQRVGGLPPSECGAPAGRANRTAWPANAGGAARREGRKRKAETLKC